MRPPMPPDIDVTDFDRHGDIFAASYLWAKNTIAALEAEGSPALEAILSSGRPPARRARSSVGFQNKALAT
jgi:NTE family protein